MDELNGGGNGEGREGEMEGGREGEREGGEGGGEGSGFHDSPPASQKCLLGEHLSWSEGLYRAYLWVHLLSLVIARGQGP